MASTSTRCGGYFRDPFLKHGGRGKGKHVHQAGDERKRETGPSLNLVPMPNSGAPLRGLPEPRVPIPVSGTVTGGARAKGVCA